MPETADAFLRFLPVILTVVGWYLVNRQNNLRENRKEFRALFDRLKVDLMEISKKSVDYKLGGAADLSEKIKWALQDLEVDLERIPDFKESDLMSAFVDFSDACMGEDFEVEGRRVLTVKSVEVQNVYLHRNRVVQLLETWFGSKFKCSLS